MLLKLLVKLVLSLNATPGWAPMQAGWLDLRPRHELAHCCLPSDGTKPCLRWHPFPIRLSERVVFVMSHDSVHLRQALLHVPQHADGFLVKDTQPDFVTDRMTDYIYGGYNLGTILSGSVTHFWK